MCREGARHSHSIANHRAPLILTAPLPGSAVTRSRPAGRFAAASARKKTGATFTPQVLATLLAERLFAGADRTRGLRVLDPACGDGALLEAAWRALQSRRHPDDAILGIDADAEAVSRARRRLGLTPGVVLSAEDFLATFADMAPVDAIIANPPWVRTQVLGAPQSSALARRFGLTGRVDLSQAFVLAMVEVLKPGGRAAVLIPNKLLQTRGAATFRRRLEARVDLVEVVDLGDTRLFEAAVLPAMLVFERRAPSVSPTPFWSVYTVPERGEASEVAGWPELWARPGRYRVPDGRCFEVLAGELDVRGTHGSWQRGGPEVRAWLDRVEAHTARRVGDLGPVRVGVKSTADPVFVTPDWSVMAPDTRPELLRPLTTHHRARAFWPLPRAPRRQILYPHEVVDGVRRAVDLSTVPRTRAWLEAHRARLEARTYVRAAGRAWYALWVPHDPNGWQSDKLVFRDIAPRSTCWLDREGTVVNGDCYWLAPASDIHPDWLFLALAVANSSFLDAWYDRVCNNRLYAGRRRYLSQFVSRYPLPALDSHAGRGLVAGARALVEKLACADVDCTAARADLDAAVWGAFGLDASDPLP